MSQARFLALESAARVALAPLLCLVLTTQTLAQKPEVLNTAVEIEKQALSAKSEYTGHGWKRSVELYLQAAHLREEGGDTKGRVISLVNAARGKVVLGDVRGAFLLLEPVLQRNNKQLDPAPRALLLSELARIALRKGQYQLCEEHYKQAIFLAENSGDAQSIGDAHFSAGEYLYERQDASGMHDAYLAALEKFRAAGNQEREAETLVAYAYTYMFQRDYVSGIQLAQQALEISKGLGDVRGRVNALVAIGNANITTGESKAAYAAYAEADILAPEDLDRTRKGQIANGLGALYEKFNDLDQSLKYRLKALDIFRKEENIAPQLYTLISAGRLSNQLNDLPSGDLFLSEGERLAKQVGDDFALAQIWIERGNKQLSNEDLSGAKVNLEHALTVFEGLNDKLYTALTLSLLGQVYERSGHLDQAARRFGASLTNNREVGSRFAESDALYNLARIRNLQGRKPEALSFIEESIRVSETLRGRVAGERLRTNYFSAVSERFEFYIDLLMQLHNQDPKGGFDVRALQASEQSRARSLLDSLQLAGVDSVGETDPEFAAREKDVRIKIVLKSDELASVLSEESPPNERTKQLKEEIDGLSMTYDQIKAELIGRSSRFRAIASPSRFDLDQYRNDVLPDDTLFLEFYLGTEKSYLWVVDSTKISSYVLPASEVIEEKAISLSRLLADRDIRQGEDLDVYHRRLAGADEQFRVFSQELSDILFGQAVDQLGEKRLVVVADRSVHYIPLAALPRPRSDSSQSLNPPLVLSNEIAYEPSANVQLLLATSGRDVPKKTAFVLADPIFSVDDDRVKSVNKDQHEVAMNYDLPRFPAERGDGETFLRLPNTQREAELISSYLDSDQITRLTGGAATRENLYRLQLTDYRILHFATHAVVNEATPDLSGIVLSRFDEAGNPQNGRLLLNDIYRLELSADLVVLSACRSGTGKEIRGEGITGLTRGFLLSGSKSVLGTLWKVDDSATAQFMKYYYESLLDKNLPPAAALRNAQLKMLTSEQWQSPYYWAAFTINGEFRSPILLKPRSKVAVVAYWIGGLLIAASLVFLLGIIWRGYSRLRVGP